MTKYTKRYFRGIIGAFWGYHGQLAYLTNEIEIENLINDFKIIIKKKVKVNMLVGHDIPKMPLLYP